MGRLHLALLGVPDVRHEGHALAFPARKALALLAYLAVERGLHSREQLVGLLWPEADESSARASLRTALARLRAALGATAGEHHLAAERDLLGLVPGSEIELDLAWVEAAYDRARAVAAMGSPPAEDRPDLIAHWEAARRWCRGEFLEGISLPDAPDFEEWVRVQREAWQQRMTVVLDCL